MTAVGLGHSQQPRGHVHPVADAVGGAKHCHAVQFYHDDAFLRGVVEDFLRAGLAEEQAVIVIATEAHRETFASYLEEHGVDVAAARRSKLLVEFDARETLTSFMVDSSPDESRFRRIIGTLINRARGTSRGRV